ncbi:hypothetical protein [Geoalkalibacter subterraneus]|uniref:hypothetical protein n=1 Tax=Geoalkalibacter subterraneus TaxID=483547 RepID=UPI000694F9E3|nr:hypothetical protein [Geoalkalibacter subterraneus]
MSDLSSIIIRQAVPLKCGDLAEMIRLVRSLYRLSRMPEYRSAVQSEAPPVAGFDPGHDSVMMGYDFHVTEQGPRLIEVNTNAGGILPTWLSTSPENTSENGLNKWAPSPRRRNQLLGTFAEEFRRFRKGEIKKPRHILILDENPPEQFLYPEMQAFADLFESWGVKASIADSAALDADENGVCYQGEPVDLIYNRHCDFYLETDEMSAILAAYRNRRVCLTPNPFTYALLGDKRRMVMWSEYERMKAVCANRRVLETVQRQVPYSTLLSQLGRDQAWQQRKELVFKPVSRFGSRGVYIGAKISRKRFATLPDQDTLAQALVPPSQLTLPGKEKPHKVDFRLFAYRDRILAVTARLYRGQVTNMSSEDSGFAPVTLT